MVLLPYIVFSLAPEFPFPKIVPLPYILTIHLLHIHFNPLPTHFHFSFQITLQLSLSFFQFFFYSHRLSSPLKKNLLNPFSFPFSSPFFQQTLPYILIPTHTYSQIFLFNHNKLYFYHHTFPFVTISYHLSNSSFFKSQLVFFHIIFSFIFPQHQSQFILFSLCLSHTPFSLFVTVTLVTVTYQSQLGLLLSLCHPSHCHYPIPAGIPM